MQSWFALAALAVPVAVPTVAAQLSKVGNITLFSDNSCADAVFVNSWTLGRDFCAKVDNSPASPVDVAFQSYVLNERPWCDNGSRPYLNIFRDEACAELIRSYPPGALYNPKGPDADGSCVAPGGSYKAMAFVCDGFEGAWGSEGSAVPTSSVEEVSTETLSTEERTSTAKSTAPAASATEASTSPIPVATSETTSAAKASSSHIGLNETTTSTSTTTPVPTSSFPGAASPLRTSSGTAVALFIPIILLLA